MCMTRKAALAGSVTLLLILAGGASVSSAGTGTPTDGRVRTVAPGVTYRVDRFDTGPLTVHTLTVDTSAPGVRVVPVKGHEDLFRGESVPAAARRLGAVAAVNADFYEPDYSPTGLFVGDGWIWKGPWVGSGGDAGKTRSVLAFGRDGTVSIGPPRFTARLAGPSGSGLDIDCVNVCSASSTTIAYTPRFGARTPAVPNGRRQVVLRLDKGGWLPNEPAGAEVVRISARGRIPLAPRTVVLDTSVTLPSWIVPGARGSLEAAMGGVRGPVVAVVGGLPRLIENGVQDPARFAREEVLPPTVVDGRYARTAVGMLPDGRTMVVVVADGNAPKNVGMSLAELASWLAARGCINALNLDGGGSSTMVVGGRLINSPSDKPRGRAVGTALVVRKNDVARRARR